MHRATEELTELMRIPSPSGNERKMADRLLKKCSELGLDAAEDRAGETFGGNAGNILAILPASDGMKDAEPILLTAHMDRVPNGDGIRPVFTEDGRITSSGDTILAADDLAGVCAILAGVRRVKESGKPHRAAEILFTVSEEKELRGAKGFDYGKLRSRRGYCMDSSGRVGRVIIGAPAIDHIEIRVHGRSAHAGASPEQGIDAIKALSRFLAEVREGRLDAESTSNFGIVRAGSATNVICALAECTGEARSYDTEKLNAYETYAEKLLHEKAAELGASSEFRTERQHGAFRIDPDHAAVTEAVRVMRGLGIEPLVENGGGGMDANIFNDRGIAAVGIATGYRKNHTFEEYLVVEEFLKAGEIVAGLLQ